MLFPTQACEMRRRRMMARLPRGPPKLRQTTLLSPQTVWMIVGVRASAPRRRIPKRVRIHASIFLSVGLLRAKTEVRLVRETKSSRSMLITPLGSMILVWT